MRPDNFSETGFPKYLPARERLFRPECPFIDAILFGVGILIAVHRTLVFDVFLPEGPFIRRFPLTPWCSHLAEPPYSCFL